MRCPFRLLNTPLGVDIGVLSTVVLVVAFIKKTCYFIFRVKVE